MRIGVAVAGLTIVIGMLAGCAPTLPPVVQPASAPAAATSATMLGSITDTAPSAPLETVPAIPVSPVSSAVLAAAAAAEVDSVMLSTMVFPNPNPGDRAVFRFTAVKPLSSANVTIYTLVGERVRALRDDAPSPAVENAGTMAYDLIFDGRNESGRDVASGVYLCALEVVTGGFRIRPRPLKLAVIRGYAVRGYDDISLGDTVAARPAAEPWSAEPREVAAHRRLAALLATLTILDGPTDDPVMSALDDQAREHLEQLRSGFGGTHAAGEAELAMAVRLIADGRVEEARAYLERAADSGYADLQARAATLIELTR